MLLAALVLFIVVLALVAVSTLIWINGAIALFGVSFLGGAAMLFGYLAALTALTTITKAALKGSA